jgi:hypothetical protein
MITEVKLCELSTFGHVNIVLSGTGDQRVFSITLEAANDLVQRLVNVVNEEAERTAEDRGKSI